jgi:hypothetical protein
MDTDGMIPQTARVPRDLCDNVAVNPNQYRDVTIHKAENGWVVIVGCKTLNLERSEYELQRD